MSKKFILISFSDGRGYLFPIAKHEIFRQAINIYNAQSLKGKIFKKLLIVLNRFNVVKLFFDQFDTSDFQILNNYDINNDNLFGFLVKKFPEEKLFFSVSLGTPGVHRKPIIQVINKNGEVLGFVKIGWNDDTIKLIDNEVKILLKLRKIPNSFIVPNVLFYEEWRNLKICFLTSPRSMYVRNAPKNLSSIYLNVLKDFSNIEFRFENIEKSLFWKNLIYRNNVANFYYQNLIKKSIDIINKRFHNIKIPFVFSHGDFTPWNSKLVEDKLFLFDWEYGDFSYPLGYDLFHFLIQTEWLLNKKTISELYKFVLQKIKGVYFKELFNNYSNLIDILLLLYLLDKLTFYAKYEENNFVKLNGLALLLEFHLRKFN